MVRIALGGGSPAGITFLSVTTAPGIGLTSRPSTLPRTEASPDAGGCATKPDVKASAKYSARADVNITRLAVRVPVFIYTRLRSGQNSILLLAVCQTHYSGL